VIIIGKIKKMKVTIEFDGTEEQDDLRVALDGGKWKNAMWELDQLLRKTTKYGTSFLLTGNLANEQEIAIAESIRESIRDILSDYNLNLE
jgi:hypothetical protein